MGWQDLLDFGARKIAAPWSGERELRLGARSWRIEGDLPREHGWYAFTLHGRSALVLATVSPQTDALEHRVRGYLVGDRIMPDDAGVPVNSTDFAVLGERVLFIDTGIDRFARICAGRACEDGPLVYVGPEMPLGPEEAVLAAYLDRKESIADVSGVTPALDAAFRLECLHRTEVARRRAELEVRRRAEEERREREERRQEISRKLGDGFGRREMARVDFETAARAALVVGGAEYLDHRPSARRGEHVVRFRIDSRRFECVCDGATLSIVDSGICLTAHRDHEFAEGTKGDSWFTLESLPSVIRQAIREGKLVVYRHVDEERYEDEEGDYE